MEYIVKKGDSLWSIAEKQLGSGQKYTDLMKINNLSKDSVILPGQKLNITSSPHRTYFVVKGDTLTSIANRYGTTVNEIVSSNKLSNPNQITIGQKLLIPSQKIYTPQQRDFQEIKNIENNINHQSNLDIINHYHRNNARDQYYLIDDKQNSRLGVYLNGNLVKSYKAIHGKK